MLDYMIVKVIVYKLLNVAGDRLKPSLHCFALLLHHQLLIQSIPLIPMLTLFFFFMRFVQKYVQDMSNSSIANTEHCLSVQV